jgi:hypothetical protein
MTFTPSARDLGIPTPLSQDIQVTPSPQSYRPVPLPRFSGQSDPRQFLMCYEAAILSVGGDDSMLVKSFIITADEATVQWYSLLSPGVIHGWDDLKQRILSNFQGFQRPELTESDLFSYKKKDKEPLQNYFRRFIHLRAQAPNVLDTITINGAIMGLRQVNFARISCAKGLNQSNACTRNSRSTVARTMTFGFVWKSSPIKRSLLKPISPTRGNGPILGVLRMLIPGMSSA